mmetsp:Transcript_10030/g.26100  ORF Transcript_10030/g.26100 Transcript_10030/m.26100 type:complete len:87 (-) Transcript_10030:4215-4475(-)
MKAAPNVLEGEMKVGAQEHFYLEPHALLAIPGETYGAFGSFDHPSDLLLHPTTRWSPTQGTIPNLPNRPTYQTNQARCTLCHAPNV